MSCISQLWRWNKSAKMGWCSSIGAGSHGEMVKLARLGIDKPFLDAAAFCNESGLAP